MKIVIPMSGFGHRFIEAGYVDPKPLIEVDGMPIIEHVTNLFSKDDEFIYICNSTHLETTNMQEILQRISPDCTIISIPPHKRGPVHAIQYAYRLIDDDEEVTVSYCDYAAYWEYERFLKHTRDRDADGCVVSYKGFHPHMLGSQNYAMMRDENQWLLEIQEKMPFTDDKMNEYASNGTYYFKTGKLLKKYSDKLIELDIHVRGEYYVSLIYNLMIEDGYKVSIFEIEHLLQWGIPKDLEIYQTWSEVFRCLACCPPPIQYDEGTKLIPLAGKGSRFSDVGYDIPKPLIEVSGHSMVIQAARSLPAVPNNVFVCLKEHLDSSNLAEEIQNDCPNSQIVELNEVTKGQACTIEYGLLNSDVDLDKPLLVGSCDSGLIIQSRVDADVIVHTFRNNPAVKNAPHLYSYVATDECGNVTGVSMKKPVSNKPSNDHAICGSFEFKKAQYFLDGLAKLYEKNITCNGEFYADSVIQECVDLGMSVKVLEVGSYSCWGTPDDYNTYNYWQSFFHKCTWHPYSIEKDPFMNPDKIKDYITKFFDTKGKNQ